MKYYVFTLEMPNVGSWNGKWSGTENNYCVVRSYPCPKRGSERLKNVSSKNYHYYNFGDGWGASVSVKEIERKSVEEIKKLSQGFCGYDWMIDEIEKYGFIKGHIS